MSYYHIRCEGVSRDKVFFAYEVNLFDVQVVDIVNKFTKGEPFWFDGQTIIPNLDTKLKIFTTPYTCVYSSEDLHKSYPQGYTGNFDGSDVTRFFNVVPPSIPRKIELLQYISFLSLDENWMLATIALQTQEVAVTIMSKRLYIILDRQNVERILDTKVSGDLTFSTKYNAFSKEVKRLHNIEMPIMTEHLRKMRTEVLHKGYSPEKEEIDAMIEFTTGFLRKLERINPKPGS